MNRAKKKICLSQLTEIKRLLRQFSLHSICEEGMCPNIAECFSHRTVTFLILGDVCTRNCSFCNVKKGVPCPVDPGEPTRVAKAVKILGMDYVVVTSVTRDDLPDGGAVAFRQTVEEIKKLGSLKKTEVLIPDFRGSEAALKTIIESGPDVISHNIETVPRLYPELRGMAEYQRSLNLLKRVKRLKPCQLTKSGIMLGLGESEEEVLDVIKDLAGAGCDLLSIGQYLSPSRTAFSVKRMVNTAEFERYRKKAEELGFKHVESGTYVRSSYNAFRYLKFSSYSLH